MFALMSSFLATVPFRCYRRNQFLQSHISVNDMFVLLSSSGILTMAGDLLMLYLRDFCSSGILTITGDLLLLCIRELHKY